MGRTKKQELIDKIFKAGDLDTFLKDYLISDNKDDLNYLCEKYLEYQEYYGEPFDVIYSKIETEIYTRDDMQKVITDIVNDMDDDELIIYGKEYGLIEDETQTQKFGAGFLGGADTVMWDRSLSENGDYKRVGVIDKGICKLEPDYENDVEAIDFSRSLGAEEFENSLTQIQSMFLELSKIKDHEKYNTSLNKIVSFAEKNDLIYTYENNVGNLIRQSEERLGELRQNYIKKSVDDTLQNHGNDIEKLNEVYEDLSEKTNNWSDESYFEKDLDRLQDRVIDLETETQNTALKTNGANILIRNEDADEYNPLTNKKRFAVEYCYSVTSNKDDISEYGLDYDYFDTEKDANNFIKNTILIPKKETPEFSQEDYDDLIDKAKKEQKPVQNTKL